MALFPFAPEMDPVTGLLALQRELERAFERPLGSEFAPSGRGVFPPVNVFSDKEGYVVRMEVPGVKPEDLTIDAENRTLTVAGKRDVGAPERASFHRRERAAGQFSRSLQLPAEVDLSRSEASLKNGVLTVRIPKREEAKPRQIAVKAA